MLAKTERKFILTKHILYRERLLVCAAFITLELARIRLVLVSHEDIEYGIFRGKVLNFDQSETRKQSFPASDRLKFGPLPQINTILS